MENISGATKVLGLIGNPVAHSLSPRIHNTFARLLGQDTAYVAFQPNPGNLEDAVRGAFALGIAGLNVTYPFKTRAAKSPISIALDGLATEAAAVNTLLHTPSGYVGYNTDVIGVQNTLTRHGVAPKSVFIEGAGAAATAAAIACARLGAKKLTIINRTKKNAEMLAQRIKIYYNVDIEFCDPHNVGSGSLAGDVYISAVSLDAADHAAIALDGFHAVLNMNYAHDTYSTSASQYAAMPLYISGIEVLVQQAAAAYEIFCGNTITISPSITNDILGAIGACPQTPTGGRYGT